MQTPSDAAVWLSVHLHFDGSVYSAECDRVVKDVVQPFVRRCAANEWIDRYFFIRYSQDGAHVRLRLHGDAKVLHHAVISHLRAFVYEADGSSAAHSQSRTHSSTGISDIRWIPYEPEWNRYGGRCGVAVAERLFHISSETCVDMLERLEPGDSQSKFGQALLSMVVLISVFTSHRSTATAFCERYCNNYLRGLAPLEGQKAALLGVFDTGFAKQSESLACYVEEAWARLEAGQFLSDTLDRYRLGLREIRAELVQLLDAGAIEDHFGRRADWGQFVSAVVPSYMHMTNNRLGIPIQDESYLGYLIARSLSTAIEQPT
jgi:thiopeptide-type bacteriocin biosynthesis protein